MTARAAGFVRSSTPMPASCTDCPANSAHIFRLMGEDIVFAAFKKER
jgi:hypothetical protein